MTTFTQICYHLVFSTKNRCPCLIQSQKEILFKYIWGIVKNKQCHLYRINGAEDHLHILTSLHPSIALADLVKDIKVSSSKIIKEQSIFPNFIAWQEGYGAFTHAIKDKVQLIEYINNQEQHHKKWSFIDEYRKLLQESGIVFDERYLS